MVLYNVKIKTKNLNNTIFLTTYICFLKTERKREKKNETEKAGTLS